MRAVSFDEIWHLWATQAGEVSPWVTLWPPSRRVGESSFHKECRERKQTLDCLIWMFGHAWTVVLFIWLSSRDAGPSLRILKQPEMARILCWRARIWTGRDFYNPSRGNTIWGIHDYRHSILMLLCHVISVTRLLCLLCLQRMMRMTRNDWRMSGASGSSSSSVRSGGQKSTPSGAGGAWADDLVT